MITRPLAQYEAQNVDCELKNWQSITPIHGATISLCAARLEPDLCGPINGLAYIAKQERRALAERELKANNESGFNVHSKEDPMRLWITCVLVLLLLILHQDYWQWERNEIVFGFLPYTMAYNIGISLATGLLWIIVCTFLWPRHLDEIGISEDAPQ